MPPLGGETAVVNWNAVAKVAVNVKESGGMIKEWLAEPLSLQLTNVLRTPALVWGVIDGARIGARRHQKIAFQPALVAIVNDAYAGIHGGIRDSLVVRGRRQRDGSLPIR